MSMAQIAPTKYIIASNGITYAYRHLNPTSPSTPLLLHIHFRANMDFWDPLLLNTLATSRPVIIFDQSGVGRSTGDIPLTYQDWANDLIAFVRALMSKGSRIAVVDLLGFSMGGYAVQMVALSAPTLVRKLIICGSGPSGSCKQVGGIIWPRETAPDEPIKMLATAKAGDRQAMENAITYSFFPHTDQGRAAAQAYFSRIYTRTIESPIFSLLEQEKSRRQRVAAKEWSTPNPTNSFHRLAELRMPVLVLNGDDDLLIPTSQSWELMRGIENAKLIVYPKSGHGFIWQRAERVGRDVGLFLDEDENRESEPKL